MLRSMRRYYLIVTGIAFTVLIICGVVLPGRLFSGSSHPGIGDYETAMQTLAREEERRADLDASFHNIRDTTLRKERIIQDLLANKITLYDAVDQFRDIMRTVRLQHSLTCYFPDMAGEELAYHLVMFWANGRISGPESERLAKLAELKLHEQ